MKWAALLFIGMIVLGILGYRYLQTALRRPQCNLMQPVRVNIEPGTTLKQALKVLASKGVVRRPRLLELLFRWYHTESDLKAGLYEFKGQLNSWDIYHLLLHGQVLTRTIAIAEGWDRWDLALYFEKQRIAPAKQVLELYTAPDLLQLIHDLDPVASDLEGYLFPSTYRIREPVNLRDVFRKMIQTFRNQWNETRSRQARALGKSVHEIVTLASLIEKETAIPEERPLVASVFWNRLRRSMRLECDPTVIYAWRLMGRNPVPLTRNDLQVDSPYNTYRYVGLPPGPIANPGLPAIDAALYPAETNYYYFVADGKGGHRFSTSYHEHLRNIRKYHRQRSLTRSPR